MRVIKKNCSKGASCGSSCISKIKKCKRKVSEEKSLRLNKLAKYSATKYLRDKSGTENSYTSKLKLNSSDTTGAVKISKSFLDPSFYQLDFEVNESYSVDKTLSKKDSIAIGKAVRTEMLALIDKAPEGTVFTAIPNAEDGNREKRVKAYKKIGFSDQDTYNEHMFAQKRNGKLVPYVYKSDADDFVDDSFDDTEYDFDSMSG